jgi:hypothetical protein
MKLYKLYEEVLVEGHNNILNINKTLSGILRQYYESGSIEGVTLPKGKLGWLISQIMGVIDEQKKYGVISSDYMNDSNWGLKPNGNLGVFDLGFGDGFDEFEVNPEEIEVTPNKNLLEIIKDKLNIKNSKYIGGGMFGYAHDIGDNKVLKITKDKTEAINSQKVMKKPLEHIANIYLVNRINIRGKEFFVIVLEKLKLFDNLIKLHKELKEYFLDIANKHINPSMIDKIKDKNVMGFIKDITNLGYKKGWEIWGGIIAKKYEYNYDTEYDFNQIADIAEWVKGSKENDNFIDHKPPDYILKLLQKLLIG